MKFSEQLKKERTNKKLTQEELSKLLGIKRSTYAKYETGENQPSYEILKKLAAFFDVTTDYLLGVQKNRNKNDYSYFSEGRKDLVVNEKTVEFLDCDKWNELEEEDKEDIKKYVEWVRHKAKKRK